MERKKPHSAVRQSRWALLLSALVAMVTVCPLSAAEAPATNLVSLDAIAGSFGVMREQRLVDGLVPGPDSPVDDFVASLFLSPDAFVLFDLGAAHSVGAVQLVSVADLAAVEWSLDGSEFTAIPLEPKGASGGFIVSAAQTPGLLARYLRLRVASGAERAAVSEFRVFETPQAVFSELAEIDPPTYQETVGLVLARKRRLRILTFFLALAVIPVILRARAAGPRARQVYAAALTAVASLSWVGFGTFHGDGRILHPWELTHYYLGSKYFNELGYTGLYEALVAHEYEAGRGSILASAEVRNLEDYTVRPVSSYTADERSQARARFSPDRWVSFREDADRVRRLFTYRHLHKLLLDHGYNAAPAHTVFLGGIVERASPLRATLLALAVADMALLAAAVGLLWWSFGPLVGAASSVLLGMSHVWGFSWTGGSLARHLWILALCGGVAFLHKRRFFLGGLLTAVAGLVRLFPLVFLAGVGSRATLAMLGSSRDRHSRLLAFGVAITLTAGFLIPSWIYGADVYAQFLQNSLTHGSADSSNELGLGVLASTGMEASALSSGAPASTGTLARRLFWAAGVVMASWLLWHFVRRSWPPWTLIPLTSPLLFASVPLSNYDYVWLVVLVPLALPSTLRTLLLFGLVAVSNLVLADSLSVATQHALLSGFLLVTLTLFFFDLVRGRSVDALHHGPS